MVISIKEFQVNALTHGYGLIGFYVLLTSVSVGIFFFVATRGALLLRSWSGSSQGKTQHVYPIYSEPWLMKLVDHQPIISAILLFQYKKLVDRIVSEIKKTVLSDKHVLITSCAFGNVIPRLVRASVNSGVSKIVITDIIAYELHHAAKKLGEFNSHIKYVEGSAICMDQENSTMGMNVLFFLLHELPNHLKETALSEACRVLSSGGKLVIAEFHRPNSIILRALSRLYFLVFEPYGLSLWDTHDPVSYLEENVECTCVRETFFFGNFQVIIATKK